MKLSKLVSALGLLVVFIFKSDAAQSSSIPFHYLTSPYYGPTFLADSAPTDNPGYVDENGFQAIHDYASTYYNVKDNIRRTTDQPTVYTRTVWMIGNSTLWGLQVADGWTISSYLQRKFNSLRLRWRVINAARHGASIRIELFDLKRLPLHRGDMVIMFDGAWDYYNKVRGQSEADQARAIASFLSVVHEARAYTLSRGATFYHFLQPGTGIDYGEYVLMASGDPVLLVPTEYFFDDIHLDDNGHAAIARQIADWLIL